MSELVLPACISSHGAVTSTAATRVAVVATLNGLPDRARAASFGLDRPKGALSKIRDSVKENPEPAWGIMDQARAMNTIIALSILHDIDGAFQCLEKTIRVFLNSDNPRLFDVPDNLPALRPLHKDDRYAKLEETYLIWIIHKK